jgi:peptidase M1-like protein
MHHATLLARIARHAAALGVAFALSAAAFGQTPGPEAPPPPPGAAPAEAGGTPAAPAAAQLGLAEVFDEFFKVGLDLEKPLAVRGLTIKRDTMELSLQEGALYLAEPVAGRVTGAYFKGTASIRIALPNAIDRKLLQGAYGKPAFEEDLGEVVLRFDDGTEREILASATPGTALAGDPGATWNDRLRIDFNAVDLQMDFLDHLMNGPAAGGFFTAEVHTRDGRSWYGFRHGGRSSIENGIYRERATASAGKRWYETLSMFHRPQDYDAKGNYNLLPGADSKDIAAVRDVQMTVEVPNTKSLLIDARLTVEALRDGVRLLRFDLINNLDAPSWHDPGRPVTTTLVADAGDRELPFLHRWHQLLVLLPRPLTRGEKTVVRVKATEDTIIQLTDRSYWIYNTYPWFPNMGYIGGRYTTDWTVKTAAPLRAAGSGVLVREWQEGGMNCVRWKSDVPVQRASLIFGDFKTTDGAHKRESPGTGEVALHLFTIQGGAEHFRGKPENVLFNISEGIKRYETIYGPFPYAQLDIAEMAHLLGFAQSPPGILLVSSILADTTVDVSRDGSMNLLQVASQGGLDKLGGGGVGDQFVFHELAHQWWGHQVGVLGDEDAWISESWAEYSAGLVIDAIDPKQFARMREGWKKRALEADPYGTIGTAYRSDTTDHPGTMQRLLYDKGPYVVHMLRSWMGWEKFSKYVATVQSRYKGTSINTNTLAREATAAMGYDMFPFFDQWVEDRGIPRVHWSWSAAPDADGKQVVTIKTSQEDKANAKILMVPITFDFGHGDPVVVQKPILTAEATIQVKVPNVPKAVRMDDDQTQLATFIAESGRK